VIGHEVSGIISAVGPGVRGLEVGARVACNLYGYCGTCAWCQAGHPNHCRRKFFSAQGFAEQAVYTAQQVFQLPDDLPLEHGAFLEPVAICLHAVDLGELHPGENVVIVGGGALGQLLVQLARRAGAATVSLSEPEPTKRELALRLGADAALDPRDGELKSYARGIGPRRGVDVVFEASGSLAAAEGGLSLLASRGRMVLVATYPRDASIAVDLSLMFDRELAVRGSLAAGRSFPRSLGLLRHLDLEPLITGIAPLEEIQTVFDRHAAGQSVKLLVAAGAAAGSASNENKEAAHA